MNASHFVAISLFGIAILLCIFALVGLPARKPATQEPVTPGQRERSLLNAIREGAGFRYLVRVRDLGPGHEPADMRYEWWILDADGALREEAYPEQGIDPDGVWGIETPWMLGSASSYDEAIRAGCGWVAEHSEYATLYLRDGGGED